MWSPELPQTIEITPTMRVLFYLVVTVAPVLAGLLGWLAHRLWKAAQVAEMYTQQLALVPQLQVAVFGSNDQEQVPGLVRRTRDLERRADRVDGVLGLDDQTAHIEAARRRLLGDPDDSGQHRPPSAERTITGSNPALRPRRTVTRPDE